MLEQLKQYYASIRPSPELNRAVLARIRRERSERREAEEKKKPKMEGPSR